MRGVVWVDADGNGVRASGEVGYSGGATVELRQGSTVIATITTDPSGQYVFSGVPPGEYTVRFVSPVGFVFSPSNQGTDDSKDSDADPITGLSGAFTLASGQDLAGPSAGIHTGVAHCMLHAVVLSPPPPCHRQGMLGGCWAYYPCLLLPDKNVLHVESEGWGPARELGPINECSEASTFTTI